MVEYALSTLGGRLTMGIFTFSSSVVELLSLKGCLIASSYHCNILTFAWSGVGPIFHYLPLESYIGKLKWIIIWIRECMSGSFLFGYSIELYFIIFQFDLPGYGGVLLSTLVVGLHGHIHIFIISCWAFKSQRMFNCQLISKMWVQWKATDGSLLTKCTFLQPKGLQPEMLMIHLTQLKG